jgi:hypothetical protein
MKNKILPISLLSVLLSFQLGAQDAKIIVNVDSLKAKVSPDLHGVFLKKSVMAGKADCTPNLSKTEDLKIFDFLKVVPWIQVG